MLVNLAIGLLAHDIPIGSSGLAIVAEHQHARMGYWLGLPYWKHGYAAEAVQAVLAYGFNQRELHWIYTPHVLSNPAPGRVL